MWTCSGQITLSKLTKICSLAIPNQISTISMHTPSFKKIHWYLLRLSSGNEISEVSRADSSVENWRNLPFSNPKPDLPNINADTKIEENPLNFTQVIVRKRKYGWMYARMTDGRTSVGRLVAKNYGQFQCIWMGFIPLATFLLRGHIRMLKKWW